MTDEKMTGLSRGDFPILFTIGAAGDRSDGQLLERYLTGTREDGEMSFAALVERHGPMVLRVCRQVLDHADDAEDAFQATFLVLARRAGSIRKRASLASWLHGVALRISRRARADSARRRIHERKGAREEALDPAGPDGGGAPVRWEALHHELESLPLLFREPVVLCHMQGLSTEAAARRLGCPLGTVLSRLSRGRERLRKGLTRRGLASTAALLANGEATHAASGSVPPSLARAVIRSAVAASLGEGAGSLIPAHVAQWTSGVQSAMILSSLKMSAMAMMAAAVLTGGALALIAPPPATTPGPQTNRAAQPAPPPVRKELDRYPALRKSAAVRKDLVWSPVPPDDHVRVLKMLAAKSRANHDAIRTWKGTYAYQSSTLLTGRSLPPALMVRYKSAPMFHEADIKVDFALDLASNSTYLDQETTRSRFRVASTRELVESVDAGTGDVRSIATPRNVLTFEVSSQAPPPAPLPGRPSRPGPRQALRLPPGERSRVDYSNPDHFLPYHGAGTLGLDNLVTALKGLRGPDRADELARRMTLSQAVSPGGLWYWIQVRHDGPRAGRSSFSTSVWSPEAGYNPVIHFFSWDRPDGPLATVNEWAWKQVDGVYIPAAYRVMSINQEGIVDHQETGTLGRCEVNHPLEPNQFDYEALGLSDGDVVVDSTTQRRFVLSHGELTDPQGPEAPR